MVLASTASSISCYKGENTDDYGAEPYKTDCGDDEGRCYHGEGYADDRYFERWGCGPCPDAADACTECYDHYCNYEGDASGASQLVMSTLSVLVPAAFLY